MLLTFLPLVALAIQANVADLTRVSDELHEPSLHKQSVPWYRRIGRTEKPPVAEIPKIIWTYWDSAEMPQFVADCIEGFRKHSRADGFIVNVVHYDTIGDHVDLERDPIPENFDKARKAHQADWVRLALLKQHGGIWMDVTSIMTRSPIWALELQQRKRVDGILFYNHGYAEPGWFNYKMYENWYIAAVPNALFVSDWLEEFNKFFTITQADGLKYVDYLKSTYGEMAFLHMKGGPVCFLNRSLVTYTLA